MNGGPEYPAPDVPLSRSPGHVPGWPRWATAADTLDECASEAEARASAALRSVVHRWPDGPWLEDDGTVWVGDPLVAPLYERAFAAEAELATACQRAMALRAALVGLVSDLAGASALPADVPMSGGLRLDPAVCSTFPAGPLPDPAPIADLPEGRRAWARGQRVRGQAWAVQQIARGEGVAAARDALRSVGEAEGRGVYEAVLAVLDAGDD